MRYFFDIEDGVVARDDDGTEVPNAQELSLVAVETIADVMRDRGNAFWNEPNLSLTVRDHEDLTLLTIQIVGTLAAAFPVSVTELRNAGTRRPRISGLVAPE